MQEAAQAQARRQAAELAKSLSAAQRSDRAAVGRLAVLGAQLEELEVGWSVSREDLSERWR